MNGFTLLLARAALAIARVISRLLERSIMATINELRDSLAALEQAQAAEAALIDTLKANVGATTGELDEIKARIDAATAAAVDAVARNTP